MNSHKFILEKVYKIQNKVLKEIEELELKGFVKFLTMKSRSKQMIDRNYNNK